LRPVFRGPRRIPRQRRRNPPEPTPRSGQLPGSRCLRGVSRPQLAGSCADLGGPGWPGAGRSWQPGRSTPRGGRRARPGGGGRRRGTDRLRGGRRSAVPRRHGGTREPYRRSVRRTDGPRHATEGPKDHAASERTSLALAGPAGAGIRFSGKSGGGFGGRFSGRRIGRLSQPGRPSRCGGGGTVVAAVVPVDVVGTPDAAPPRPVRRCRYRWARGQQRCASAAARSVAGGVATRDRRGGRGRDRAQLRAERDVDLPAPQVVGPAVRRVQPGRGGLAADQRRRRRPARRHRPVLPAREPGRYRRCFRHQLRGQLDVDLE
jgi:hypothetical protein